MRKISIDAAVAFTRMKPFKRDNTEVVVGVNNPDGMYAKLKLHSNTIAVKTHKSLKVTTCGWNTTTTRARLNALPGVSVRTKQGQLFLNDVPWSGALIDPDLIVCELLGETA